MARKYLVLLHEKRLCRVCRKETYWTLETMLWSEKGICLEHAGPAVYERGDLPTGQQAYVAVVRALGPVDELPLSEPDETAVETLTTVRWMWVIAGVVQRVTAWLGSSYVGRCAGCGTTIRRYGPAGRPLCDTCESGGTDGIRKAS